MLQVKASEAAEPDEQEDIRVRKEIRLYRCSDQESHHTGIGLKLGPRLREFFPRGQREPGAGFTQPRVQLLSDPCT